jgi:hypothetical protein
MNCNREAKSVIRNKLKCIMKNNMTNRRDFIKTTAMLSGAGMFVHSPLKGYNMKKNPEKLITVADVDSNFEREPITVLSDLKVDI